MYGFNGFGNVNYALPEVHNAARTLRIAGPLSIMVNRHFLPAFQYRVFRYSE